MQKLHLYAGDILFSWITSVNWFSKPDTYPDGEVWSEKKGGEI